MDYETILTVRLDTDLAERFGEFRHRFNVKTSDFLRAAIIERMEKWPQLMAESQDRGDGQ